MTIDDRSSGDQHGRRIDGLFLKLRKESAVTSAESELTDSAAVAAGSPGKRIRRPKNGKKFVCTLPGKLLDTLKNTLGQDALPLESWEQEYDWSRRAGDHSQAVGFSGDNPIIYYHLRRAGMADLIDQVTLDRLNWPYTLQQVERMFATLDARTKRMWTVSQGYIGWLMTTREFLDEHDDLIASYRAEIERYGQPGLPRAIAWRVPKDMLVKPAPRLQACNQAFDAFYLRWRLTSLAAPYLPVPLQPQTPVAAPILALGPQRQGGSLFFIPDTFPIPSRDELRKILEESLRNRSAPAHLAGWHKLVGGRNPAKNQIARHGRLFEIQHYCRILQQRHPEALAGRLGKLELALSAFLQAKEATIHADFGLIRRRLGPDWMSRGSGFELGAEPATPRTMPAARPPSHRSPRTKPR